MSWIDVWITGLVQGLTQFLPLSSFTHVLLLQETREIAQDGLLLSCMLHLGGAVAVLITYHRDFLRIFSELLGIVADSIGNLYIYFHNRRTRENPLPYNRVIVGTWRKLSSLMVLSALITAFLGSLARDLVVVSMNSPLILGTLSLVTGVFLLVTDLGKLGGKKSIREVGLDAGIWLGIAQGVSVFPGISRFAMTFCAGLMCGLSRKVIAKFSCLMSVPVVIGAFLMEMDSFASLEGGMGRSYWAAAIVTCLLSCFLIRRILKVLPKIPLTLFALYHFILGGVVLIRAFH